MLACFKRINDISYSVKHNVYIDTLIQPFKICLTNYRRILIVLIVYLLLFSLFLTGVSIYLTTIFYFKDSPTNWSNWLALSFLGICLAVICSLGLRGASVVNLDLLLTYLWGISIFIAPLILGTIVCFDFYDLMYTWFIHAWDQDTFLEVRSLFCEEGTSLTKCSAPSSAASFNTTYMSEWCDSMYSTTDCTTIRETAIESAVSWGRQLAIVIAALSILALLVITLSIYVCTKILSANVITESMNDIVNYILFLPIGGCIGVAIYLADWINYKNIPYTWLSNVFIALATAQGVTLPIGFIAGRLKKQFLMTIYMILMIFCITGLGFAGGTSLVYAGLISEVYQPDTSDAEQIACYKKLTGCCCCDTDGTCPEWSTSDVVSLLVLELKIAGVIACSCMIYLIGAFIVGGFMRKSLQNYKSDYV